MKETLQISEFIRSNYKYKEVVAILDTEFLELRRLSNEYHQISFLWDYMNKYMKDMLTPLQLERYRYAYYRKQSLLQMEVNRASRIIYNWDTRNKIDDWEFSNFNILTLYSNCPIYIPDYFKNRIILPLESFNETLNVLYQKKWNRIVAENGWESYAENSVRSITFQVSEACNLRCTYCYQIAKTPNRMSFDTAKKLIDFMLSDEETDYMHKPSTFGLVWDFIGGEPFMEPELITKICHYILQQMIKTEHRWLLTSRFSASTNGTLHMTKPVQQILDTFGPYFSVGVTVDGNKELHDKCRIFEDGSGSYDLAIQAIKDLRQRGNKIQSKVTISDQNLPYLYDAIKHMIDIGYIDIHANCVFENVWDETIHPQIYYQQLKKIADYFLEKDLYNKVFLSIFREDGIGHMDDSQNKNFCGGNGAMLSVNYAGRLYPCVRFMESSLGNDVPPYSIGNVDEGLLSTKEDRDRFNLLKSVTRKSQFSQECWDCPVNKGCAHCTAYNYQCFGTPNKRATYICWMHKAEVLANWYYWTQIRMKYPIPGLEWILHLPKEDALKIISQNEYDKIMNCQLKMLEISNNLDLKNRGE